VARQPDRRESASLGIFDSLKSTGFWSAVGAVVGIVGTIVGVVLFLTAEPLRDFAVSVLIIGLVLLFLAVVLSPRAIAIFMAGRQGRYGANLAIMTAAFFIIVILINFLLFRNPTRVDVTATRVFSLSQQTINILGDLNAPIRANAFFVPGNTQTASVRQQAEDLLNEFTRRTGQFTYRFVDPELNRSVAERYNVTDYPVVVFENLTTDTLEDVYGLSEQDFVTAMLVVTGIDQKKVYFLTGHGEAGISRDPISLQTDLEGFDLALNGMQRDNYAIRPLNLRQDPKIPEDAAVVVVPGPKGDLSEDEENAITEYLVNGGGIVFLLDPDTPESFRRVLANWGLLLAPYPVADLISNVAGESTTPMAQRSNGQFASGAITDIPIANRINVAFFADATAVQPVLPLEEIPPFMTYSPLVLTTPASWLETDEEEVKYDADEDIRGQFHLVGVMETGSSLSGQIVAEQKTARLVVFGDSDFARNKFFFQSDNSNLFLNTVNWLAGDYNLIDIRPRIIVYRELVLNQRERDFIKWSSWFFPPTLMLILGAIVWWRRR
jgi:hypothetical protein